VTADVLLDNVVEQSTQSYLVTEVRNMWEVSMGGSHIRYVREVGQDSDTYFRMLQFIVELVI
jgi:hypothetical protein